jgi:hypothetical protein
MSEQSIKETRRTALEFAKRSKKEVTEKEIQERLERKMEGLLAARYHECLLIFDGNYPLTLGLEVLILSLFL